VERRVPELPAPFRSPESFRTVFVEGLARLIAEPGLGTFILALANASFDPHLHHLLAPRLALRFEELAERCREALRRGRPIAEPPDDLLVFLKLAAIGIEGLPTTAYRRAGPWELQFNVLRSFRPPRATAARIDAVSAPFAPDGFHFDKPFLRRELLWEGELAGRLGGLYYNKFPFVDLHGIWVPEPAARRPQLLTEDDHAHAWKLVATLGRSLPGAGLGYNAYGAGASVNHLHFQTFVRPEPLPIEDHAWAHNGGVAVYPAACDVHDDCGRAWRAIEALHAANRPYNLLYRPGRIYLVARVFQGAVRHAPWVGGLAWYEIAGGFTCFDVDDLQRLHADDVRVELAQAAPRRPR
jgi:hypothetical protein